MWVESTNKFLARAFASPDFESSYRIVAKPLYIYNDFNDLKVVLALESVSGSAFTFAGQLHYSLLIRGYVSDVGVMLVVLEAPLP